ncbi:putative nuclease/nucleotidase/phosphoesterase [Alkalihalophilus pseudofirmus OF4]|uniref:Nuclease/nucleotidase/phosphoesterase n=1 Tax=Alkalihalophilus pseudofirmus (strain ATCC BAA-2126 / JCM 17055 / OF4) TaxID=398511 RepID=D3FZ35_ALKPO|nr:bifunctional UDP-sugar hydrolase/5'-nucleotidase [Alkalihalophilus pseudofirmus]ADC49068.1 putative nuclease/nucleotidase/phosphoesterase [Alkalihalophilus pseudofirmus OF4]
MSVERITIYHTNDIHSGFDTWAKLVAYIKQHKDPNSLYVDLGDHADRSHPITEATSGAGNVSLLNEAGVEYATIGNNEGITFSHDELDALYTNAQFQVLISNLFTAEGKRPRWTKPYAIHQTKNGVKIALIGATAPFKQFYHQLDWKITPPIEAIKQCVEEVRDKVDVVIVLSHLGLFRDEELAEVVEGIDVILGAHTHHVLEKGKRRYGTLIAQAGKHGAYLGKVTIDVDLKTKTVAADEAELIDPASLVEEDDATLALLDQLNQDSETALAKHIANLPRVLPVSWQEESEASQILCDALTEWCKEEIGMMNAGVLLETFTEGPVTMQDVHRSCPHPINPCVVELTGAALRSTIIRSFSTEMRTLALKGFGFRGKVLGRMIFTGIEVELDKYEQVTEVLILGKPLDLNQTYTIATLDMYTFGHLYPAIADAKKKTYYMPELLRDVLSWKLGQIWA